MHAESQRFALAQQLIPLLEPGAVEVDNRLTISGQARQNFRLGQGNIFRTAKTTDMGHPGIGQDADAGARQLHAVVDIAHLGCTHFDHSELMLRLQLKQGQWHAQFVVQVATGGQHRAAFTQHGGKHLLDRGFAARTGNPHHRAIKGVARQCAKLSEGITAVMHQQLRQRVVHQITDHGGSRTVFTGLCQVVVTIHLITGQGDKQAAWLYLAGVNADAIERRISAGQTGQQRLQKV